MASKSMVAGIFSLFFLGMALPESCLAACTDQALPSGYTKSQICTMASVRNSDTCPHGVGGVTSYLNNATNAIKVCLQYSPGVYKLYAIGFMKYCATGIAMACPGDCGCANPLAAFTCGGDYSGCITRGSATGCLDNCCLLGWTATGCSPSVPTYTEIMRVRCPSPVGEVRIAGILNGTSSLKMQKDGDTYGVALVAPGDSEASCVNVQMPAPVGQRALRKCGGTAPNCT